MVVAILAVLAVALLATLALSRTTGADADRNDTVSRLNHAADAVDQFAAANHRLPCAADPTLDTGVEAITAVNAATCLPAADEGTLPWKTLGLKRDDSLDAWGDKISYRVYTGNKGSLVQPEGVNMTECDTVEPSSGNTTAAAGSAGGLCVTSTDPTLRSTSVAKYLQGKGLSLSDNGAARDNVAYLLLSHGKTGYGAYTTSGVRKAYSDVKGDELKNTSANGPFTIRAFSDVDVEANTTQHFDDLVVYRTLTDLAARTGLAARDWPDNGVVGQGRFDAATLAAAVGQATLTPGNLGTATVNVGVVAATSSAGNLALVTSTLNNPAPDGSTTVDSLGVVSVFGNFLNTFDNAFITVTFNNDVTRFAVTLADFGTYYSGSYLEQAQFIFRDSSGAQVGSAVTKTACRADHTLASFTLASSTFRSVEIHPYYAVAGGFVGLPSIFTVAEVKACNSTAASCATSLAAASNDCP